LCREICGQSGHAEANAIRVAGARAIGGTLLLIGHDTVCEDCVTLMRQAGIDKCVIVSDSGSKNMGEFK
jgi:deoxycytidylate deaminase